MNLFTVELKKFVRRKKFFIGAALLLGIFFACMTLILVRMTKDLDPQNKIHGMKQYIATFEEQQKLGQEKGTTESMNMAYEKIIGDLKKDLAHLETMAEESIPWQERVKKDIAYSQEKIKHFPTSFDIQEKEMANIRLKEYHLKHNIPYDYSKKLNSFTVIPEVFYAFGFLGLFIVVGVMVVDTVSGENKPATIKFLLTKPIKRWKFIFTKFIVAVLVINVLVLGVELISFIILGEIYGFGDPSLPALVGTKYELVPTAYIEEVKAVVTPVLGSTFLMSKGVVMLKVLLLQTLAITACIAFCLLCSTLIQDSATATGVTLLSISFMHVMILYKEINGFPLEPTGIFNKGLAFLFPSYYNGQSILAGDINKALGITFVDFPFAILVLLGWIVICYTLSQICFMKKDIIA